MARDKQKQSQSIDYAKYLNDVAVLPIPAVLGS
jgi:hypothetical protein